MLEVAWLDSLQGSGIRPGLTRMRELLRAAGRPQRSAPTVIVAGTNGKGSTSATIASIASAAGYRTGFYSSPHLVTLLERWQIDGRNVDEAAFVQGVHQLQRASEKAAIRPTYFEALTVLAFLLFRNARCELSVLEVGMGGRLDATNVTRPLVAAITPIGIDHTEYLGSTLRKIAREKAGVIHRGTIALTSNRDPQVVEVIRRRAAAFGSPLHEVLGECAASNPQSSLEGVAFTLRTPRREYALASPLPGEHQIENIMLAVRSAEELQDRFDRIDAESIVRGVRTVRWRGRMERFALEGCDVIVDGAHNGHAARRIVPFIEKELKRPRTLVFGMLSDKDVREVAAVLFPHFDRIVLTRPDSERAMEPEALLELARSFAEAGVVRSPDDAVEAAVRQGAGSVLVAGSLYLAGSAVALLDRLKKDVRAKS